MGLVTPDFPGCFLNIWASGQVVPKSFGRMPWNYQPGSSLCALGYESLPSITLCPRAFCWGLCHSSPYPACSKPNDLLSLLWVEAHICSI